MGEGMIEEPTVPTVGHDEELRGSAPAMTTKDLLLEVWRDMKFVRPAVEGLIAAGLIQRVEAIERDHVARDERGGSPPELVERLEALEAWHDDLESRGLERRRIADISGRTLALVIVVSNFVLGAVIVLLNLLSEGPGRPF